MKNDPKIKYEGPGFIVLDTDINLEQMLDELGFSPTSFFWKDEYRERAEQVYQDYSPGISLMVQYVFQGGARDLDEFMEGYQRQFEYRKQKGYLPQDADPSEHKDLVKTLMSEVSSRIGLDFIFCPFMKARASDVVRHGAEDPWELKDAICYVLNGCDSEEFEMTPERKEEKEKYLKAIGIID